MTRSIPGGVKDANGIYQSLPAKPEIKAEVVKEDTSDVDIDHELSRVLRVTRTFLNHISVDVNQGDIKRDTGDNLKKCVDILMTLKKYEKDLLDNMSDEDLEKLTK